jgi:hypothetical protein
VSGIVTDSDPSLGVLAARIVGKVKPPSVDREIVTFAVLTGAAVVPATLQVTSWVDVPTQVRAVFGCVTANGPAEVVEVTCATS